MRTIEGLVKVPQVLIDVDRGTVRVWPEDQCTFCWDIGHVLAGCPRLAQHKFATGKDYWCGGCGRGNHHLVRYCLQDPFTDRRRMEDRRLCYETSATAVYKEAGRIEWSHWQMTSSNTALHLKGSSFRIHPVAL